tara:strand:- start:903 stop:1991 length:1089 start_codon:yes stop_codon:yes gene_type:complete
MVYLKNKNTNTNLDTKKENNTLHNVGCLVIKIMVLSLILLLGNKKVWSYLNTGNITNDNQKFNILFSVIVFVIMVLFYIAKSTRSQLDILFSCIVVVYLIYIWTRKDNNKDSFIVMDTLGEDSMDLIHHNKYNNQSIGMYPIEKEREEHELVHGLNKPEHYDYTPDDIPTYQMRDELKIFKQMSDMKKKDINAEWMNKVEGHDPKFIPGMEGGFPFYNTKEKVHDLFDNKHHQEDWNESILTALQECPRTPKHLLDKSGDGLPDISHYHRKNGSGQSQYKYLDEKDPKLGIGDKLTNSCSVVEEENGENIMNEYAYASDEVNFKIGSNSMNISQSCSNFPIPGYTNLKKINDNIAHGIDNVE